MRNVFTLGYALYIVGVALGFATALVDDTIFRWPVYGAPACMALLSIPVSSRVRSFLLLGGVFPPALLALALTTVIYPIDVPAAAFLWIGAIKSFAESSRFYGAWHRTV